MAKILVENQQKIQPAYMVLLDYEIVPAVTLEAAIDMASSSNEIVEIYKRHGTTGPCFYEYLCNIEKVKGGDD